VDIEEAGNPNGDESKQITKNQYLNKKAPAENFFSAGAISIIQFWFTMQS